MRRPLAPPSSPNCRAPRSTLTCRRRPPPCRPFAPHTQVVSEKLSQHVLANYDRFVAGVEEVGQVERSLVETHATTKHARERLALALREVGGGLRSPGSVHASASVTGGVTKVKRRCMQGGGSSCGARGAGRPGTHSTPFHCGPPTPSGVHKPQNLKGHAAQAGADGAAGGAAQAAAGAQPAARAQVGGAGPAGMFHRRGEPTSPALRATMRRVPWPAVPSPADPTSSPLQGGAGGRRVCRGPVAVRALHPVDGGAGGWAEGGAGGGWALGQGDGLGGGGGRGTTQEEESSGVEGGKAAALPSDTPSLLPPPPPSPRSCAAAPTACTPTPCRGWRALWLPSAPTSAPPTTPKFWRATCSWGTWGRWGWGVRRDVGQVGAGAARRAAACSGSQDGRSIRTGARQPCLLAGAQPCWPRPSLFSPPLQLSSATRCSLRSLPPSPPPPPRWCEACC